MTIIINTMFGRNQQTFKIFQLPTNPKSKNFSHHSPNRAKIAISTISALKSETRRSSASHRIERAEAREINQRSPRYRVTRALFPLLSLSLRAMYHQRAHTRRKGNIGTSEFPYKFAAIHLRTHRAKRKRVKKTRGRQWRSGAFAEFSGPQSSRRFDIS